MMSALVTFGFTSLSNVTTPFRIVTVSGGRLSSHDSWLVATSATFLSMTLTTVIVLLGNVGSAFPATCVLAVKLNVQRLGAR